MLSKNKSLLAFILPAGALIIIYSFLKAYLIPFTGDEIYTYENYVKKGFTTFHEYANMDANNHLLNTWLMELFYRVFGDSEFCLRIPNLLAQIIFMLFSFKMVCKLSSRILIITSFILLNTNPFINDYFCLARGYGLSISLMIVSIYYALEFIRENKSVKLAFLSSFFAAISVLANFTLLNYFLFVSVYLATYYLSKNKNSSTGNRFKSVALILLPNCVLFFIIPLLLNLKEAEALYYGGKSGFTIDAIDSLIKETFYYQKDLLKFVSFFENFIYIILISSVALVLFSFFKKTKMDIYQNFIFISAIIFLCFTANYFQFEYMAINLPKGRSAVFYIPLFYLLLIFLLDILSINFQRVAVFVSVLFFLLTVFNFISSFSLDTIIRYKVNSDVKNLINYFRTNIKNIPPEKNTISIGVDSSFAEEINPYRFYYKSLHINFLEKSNAFHPLHDYYFIHQKDISQLKSKALKVLKVFPKSNMVLLSNEQKWRKKEIVSVTMDYEKYDNKTEFYNRTTDQAFHGIFSSITDSNSRFSGGILLKVNDSLLNHKNKLVIIKTMVYAEKLDGKVALVTSFENDAGSYLFLKTFITDYIVQEKTWSPIYFSCFLPDKIEKNDFIKVYLLNNGNFRVYTDDLEFKVVEYD